MLTIAVGLEKLHVIFNASHPLTYFSVPALMNCFCRGYDYDVGRDLKFNDHIIILSWYKPIIFLIKKKEAHYLP